MNIVKDKMNCCSTPAPKKHSLMMKKMGINNRPVIRMGQNQKPLISKMGVC